MAHDIVIWPAPVLTTPTRRVTDFAALPPLLERMAQAMAEAEGIGIAANQIGVDLRLALCTREDGTWFEIVNPEIILREEPVTMLEGCLSVPGEFHDVTRFRKVRVRYQDRTGETLETESSEKLAHIFQHEIDHLDGTVYVQHVSPLLRRLIRERMLKRQKQQARRRD
jgi:peptide deformylase